MFVLASYAQPSNDNPCNARVISNISERCDFVRYNNTNATPSTITKPGCTSASSSRVYDVWYSVTVPSNGKLYILTANYGSANPTISVYTGSCSSLSQIYCENYDDFLNLSSLTPNSTIFIRIHDENGTNNMSFDMCINSPINDNFANAVSLCNPNNYNGLTSTAYSVDKPANLVGGGSCPVPGDGIFAGTLQNNAWFSFIAQSNVATFTFTKEGCYNNPQSGDGIQVGVFEYNSVTNKFTLKSQCAITDGSNQNFTLNATGLTSCTKYYMMIDGNQGATCKYVMNATSGVLNSNAGPDQSICGTSAILAATANVGSGGCSSVSGLWTLVSGSGTFANATLPNTTVSGLSIGSNIFKWTLTGMCSNAFDEVTITVNPDLTPTFTQVAAICSGSVAPTLPTTSNNGITGTWNPATISTSTVGTQTYTFTPTSTSAPTCAAPTTMDIEIKAPATSNAGIAATICSGSSYTLTGSSVGGSATTGAWSITSVTGTMTNASTQLSSTSQIGTPNTVTFTPILGNTGTVTLTLTTNDPDGAGGCPATTATVVLTVTQPAQPTLACYESATFNTTS